MSDIEPQCPTPTGHKRLEEIHHHWHRCVDSYQDPEEFRISLNAAIQATRNLTFAIQSQKALIQQFDDWYGSWQARMKADPILNWANEARRKIVHIGDLETRSRAVARLIIDYDDAAAEVVPGGTKSHGRTTLTDDKGGVEQGSSDREVEAPPLSSLTDILTMVSGLGLPLRVFRESTLSIERRWEDVALPGHELTEALAHVYGFLSQLIHDAHERAGIDHGTVMDFHGEVVRLFEDPTNGGRLPCMVTTRRERTVTFNVHDGKIAEGGRMWRVAPDPEILKRARKFYKLSPGEMEHPPTMPDSILDAVPWYVDRAKAILRAGEEHGWFVFLFRGKEVVDSRVLYVRGAADKRALAQELADIVATNGIDGVIQVGESWQSPMTRTVDGTYVKPSAHPERTENVVVMAEVASGESRTTVIPFERVGRKGKRRKVQIQPIIEDFAMTDNFLAPVRAVWRAKGLNQERSRPGASFFKGST